MSTEEELLPSYKSSIYLNYGRGKGSYSTTSVIFETRLAQPHTSWQLVPLLRVGFIGVKGFNEKYSRLNLALFQAGLLLGRNHHHLELFYGPHAAYADDETLGFSGISMGYRYQNESKRLMLRCGLGIFEGLYAGAGINLFNYKPWSMAIPHRTWKQQHLEEKKPFYIWSVHTTFGPGYFTKLAAHVEVMRTKGRDFNWLARIGGYVIREIGYGFQEELISPQIGFITGWGKHHTELAAGFGITVSDLARWSPDGLFPTGLLAYRYQKLDGGLIFRSGFGFPEFLFVGLGFSLP